MMKYDKEKGWAWTNPNKPDSKPIYQGSEEAAQVREEGLQRAKGLRDAHYYDPNKDYSGAWGGLFNAEANGGSNFGSWTNHLHYRLGKSKTDDFWQKENPFGGAGYGFKGYNEMKQSSGMGYDIMDRNNAIYDMLRKGWGWDQVMDITRGKLDPSQGKADYKDFYRDIGYDPSSGQSLEDAVANAPAWVKDFYQFDMANAAGSANNGGGGGNTGGGGDTGGGGMLGPITPAKRGQRKGVWGGGYKDGGYGLAPSPNEGAGNPNARTAYDKGRPGTPHPGAAPMSDDTGFFNGGAGGTRMFSQENEGMRKAITNALEKKLLG